MVPLLHLLAEYLTKEAGHLIQITNIIIHARVPIIKAVSVDPHLHTPHTSAGFSPGQSDVYQPIHIDISIDSPLHSGLATTEMVCTLMQGLPPLGPVVSVLKDYLKLKGLADAFTGGLNSYGLFILMLLPLLKQLRDSRDLLGCEPIGGITGSGSGAVTPVGPTGAVSSAVTTEAVDAKAATVEDENASPSPNLSPEPLAPDSAHGGRLSPGQDAAVRANASSSSSSSGSGSSGTLVSKPTDAASAPDGFGHGDGMLVDTKCSIRGSRDTDSDRDSDRDRHTIDYIQTRDGGNASTGVDSKAANYCLDPINLAARLDECDSSDLANGSGSPLAGQAEVEVELEVEGKPIERTERGTSSKVTSVYMEAVARAALSKKNSNDSIKAHMSKGASERKLKSLKTSSDVGQMDNSYPGDRDESWSRRKSNAVCVSVIDTQNTDASLALPGDDQSPPAPCIPHAPPPSPMPNPDPSSAATANRASSFERNSNTPTRTSTPARPPLRPTPPVTLKEYLTTKHLLHSTYTVARSALKPSQSGTLPPLPPPAPSSPNSPQQSSSQSTPPLAAPSKSSTAYDSSIGIASHPTKSFQTSFSSSGAIATYQYLRPKSTTSFNRNQNISPIATPKQSLGQMQLSSSKKFPIRIIFSSPPSFSPYKHTSGPSSSSISKAGALYIMNVMNNHHGYTWTNLKQQREFGRKVAFKLLDSPDNGDFNRCNLRDPKKSNFGNSNRDMRVPCVLPLEAPILGSLLQDFLLAYGKLPDLLCCNSLLATATTHFLTFSRSPLLSQERNCSAGGTDTALETTDFASTSTWTRGQTTARDMD